MSPEETGSNWIKHFDTNNLQDYINELKLGMNKTFVQSGNSILEKETNVPKDAYPNRSIPLSPKDRYGANSGMNMTRPITNNVGNRMKTAGTNIPRPTRPMVMSTDNALSESLN